MFDELVVVTQAIVVQNAVFVDHNGVVEAAAAWVAESVPKPAPAAGYDYLPSTVDPFGTASKDETWAALHKSPDQWLTAELRSIVRDPEFTRLGGA